MHADEQQKGQVVENVSDVQEYPSLSRWRRKLESGVHSGTRWNCGGTGGVARRDCQAIAYSGGIPDRPCRKDNEDLLVDTILKDCIDDQDL